jgi:hypothetical protein
MNLNETLERLRPHQREPFTHLGGVLSSHFSAVDLSDMGTGKTYVAAAVASQSRLPTLVVCPKVAISAWQRAAELFEDKFSIVGYEQLRFGRTPFGHWDNPDPRTILTFRCVNCQCVVDMHNAAPCYCIPSGIHCIETRKKQARYGDFHFSRGVAQVIFDEVHRCGALDSLNADMLIAAKKQRIRTLGLSATAASSPLGMKALGYLLDFHSLNADSLTLPSFHHWLRSTGCQWQQETRGWRWMVGAQKQVEIMATIRSQIVPERGVRVRCDDIPGFPECDIQAELYTLDDPEKIDGCYREMAEATERLKERASFDVDPENPLTKMLRAKQQVELLKVPVFAELGEDYLAKGFTVVFFVNYRQTIDELEKRFPDFPIIDGTATSVKNREKYVELVQTNRVRGAIVNSQVGGVCLSLHDLGGLHPRVGLVSPPWSAIVLRQLFGRFRRDGGRSRSYYRILFADKTVEVKSHRAVSSKLNCIDSLNDGDLNPVNLKYK